MLVRGDRKEESGWSSIRAGRLRKCSAVSKCAAYGHWAMGS